MIQKFNPTSSLGRTGSGEIQLLCPVCGHDCVHATNAGMLVGSDQHEAVIYPSTELFGTTDERRSALVLRFWCEEDHTFDLIFQQHKGCTFIYVEQLPDSGAFSDGDDGKALKELSERRKIEAEIRVLQLKLKLLGR